MKDDIVIVSASRTPLGSFQGSLSGFTAPQLAAELIRHVIRSQPAMAQHIDELILGNVLSAGLGQAPVRQAALLAGLPESLSTTAVSKVCGSGMKSIMLAYDQLKAGSAQCVLCGGMESMSAAPYLLPKARNGLRLGHGEVLDHMFLDGLQNASDGKLMGCFADQNSAVEGFSREALDEYALRSLSRAQSAIDKAYFKDEIVPISLEQKTGSQVIDSDEQPARARPEKIPTLKPAFAKDGVTTAANASSISDGAALLLVMTAANAEAHGLRPLATVKGHASYAQAPALFTQAPVGAISALLEKVSWSLEEVDLFEINEAFAMVPMTAMKHLGISAEKVNVQGGACALGHPIGASGARIVVTLIYALRRLGLQKGIASICIGGGEATALALEIC